MARTNDTIYRLDDIEYSIAKHPRRKRASIVITREDGVSVRIPRYYSLKAAHAFIEEHQDWVRRKCGEIRKKHSHIEARAFADGEFIPYLGDMYVLETAESALPLVSVLGNRIRVHLTPGAEGVSRRDRIVTLLTDWYAARAAETIAERLRRYAPLLGVGPSSVKIKSTRSIWGSCTAKGTLNFNWKVILAPIHIVDYLVVHELCHLVHRNHSRRYWKLVESVAPDYRERDAWLRKNGSTLTL